ncbi:MAG: class II aldolase/adducin family protein [Micropepsaceae bacterium]
MDSNAELSQKLNKAWRFFYGRGFIDGFGHISARTSIANQILISPHSLAHDSKPEDFLLVDLDGKILAGEGNVPGELAIHLELYKHRSDIGSVAHFHCLYATSFSMSDVPLGTSYFLGSIFRSGIPIHPDSRFINDVERGEALAKTLGNHRAALLKAHGVVVTGPDIVEMVGGAFILEDNARRTWTSAAMGNVEFLSDEIMQEIEAEVMKSGGPFRRIWALCESEYEAG